MQTHFSAALLATDEGKEADAILRRCVHCGFCTATCPTYQLLGDELDGPRGRIYLIKQLLEDDTAATSPVQKDDAGVPPAGLPVGTIGEPISGKSTRQHLDRCLTCRSCETTCPSGVEYSRLLDIGRERIEQLAPRPLNQRLLRWGLRQLIPYPARFRALLAVARPLSGLMPRAWREALPPAPQGDGPWPVARHSRRVILFQGCVQSVAGAEINLAAARVLDHLGISALRVEGEGCCGALDQHLAAPESAADFMRANIDRWWPLLEDGVEAIVGTASACGLQLKDYGHLLRNDPAYARKAEALSAKVMDIAEVLASETPDSSSHEPVRVAFHAPCTLQHGQQLGGVVEEILQSWGFTPVPVAEAHLCCGSAGTYSITQPELSQQLRANKLAALQATEPAVIASANIGCLMHLRSQAEVPVRHWVELLADRL